MFSNNFFLFVLVSVIVLAVGGMYFAYIISQPASKQSVDPRGLSQSNDPLVNARAGYLQKLQEITKPIMTRYLVYIQEKRDVDGYADSSLTRFEQECDSLYDEWRKETQLCRSEYMIKQIFEKYSSRIELLCADQNKHLEKISNLPSGNRKNLSVTA